MESGHVVRVEEFDSMTPQERADSVLSGIVRSWDDVEPELRARIAAKAAAVEHRRSQRG